VVQLDSAKMRMRTTGKGGPGDGRLFEISQSREPAAEPPRFGTSLINRIGSPATSSQPRTGRAQREKPEPSGEKTDEAELHYSGYKVIEPLPESPRKIINTEPQIASE